jgi:hypothetical protein
MTKFESNLDRAKRLTDEERIYETALLACPPQADGAVLESDLLRCVEEELTRCEARDALMPPELWQRWIAHIKGRFPERPPRDVRGAAINEFNTQHMDEDDRGEHWLWPMLGEPMPKGLARQLETYLRARFPAFNAGMAGTQAEAVAAFRRDKFCFTSIGRKLKAYIDDCADRRLAYPWQPPSGAGRRQRCARIAALNCGLCD